MRNTVGALSRYNKEKEEVDNMIKVTVFSSDVEEILDEDNRTVSMYIKHLDEIVEVTMNQAYMTLDEGVQLLIDKLKKHNNIEVEYLTDTTLILKGVHKNGSEVSLRFIEEDTNYIYEVNFNDATHTSLMDFIENEEPRIFSILRDVLEVDIVKIIF